MVVAATGMDNTVRSFMHLHGEGRVMFQLTCCNGIVSLPFRQQRTVLVFSEYFFLRSDTDYI